MAGASEVSQSTSIATTSYDTALCVIPAQNQCHQIDQLRSLYDKAYGKWPAHINLIYPFVAPESLAKARERIQAHFVDAPQLPLRANLNRSGHFKHKTNSTLFLGESSLAGKSSLDFLRARALEALGHAPTPCELHLTIGQSADETDSAKHFLLDKVSLLSPLDLTIHSLAILVRERSSGQNSASSRMRLWSTIDITVPERTLSPLQEFWLNSDDCAKEDFGDEELDSVESPSRESFIRKIQPETTYCFGPTVNKWITCSKPSATDIQIAHMTVASYNVLVDSEYPPARDRDALLVNTIVSQSALADILVLQEVSDEFLSYLLGASEIYNWYQFTSHAPPSQPDIGPLPSLRNVVILSKWFFRWESVPFHRRHKSAVVATFPAIRQLESSMTSPLVVAGVHLTCGLTDGSVAAKRVQLQNITNYLRSSHLTSPWLIAGDFNITTSAYTIETAIASKSISQHTVESLLAMESRITEVGLLDAWYVARLEGVDKVDVGIDPDDVLDGEDGATFNPMTNRLAAATSGTSNHRPQRYDRILYRPQEMFNIKRFNHFGLPEMQGGTEIVPSDHSGIRASFNMVAGADKSSANIDLSSQYLVQLKQIHSSLSDSSALSRTLTTHHMFPTEIEAQGRRDAFALIREVLLRSHDNNDSVNSDIPMVIVPVGSYALGVWTSASDIDCLCIGSISSKTFFKLARQRIRKAEALGVRLLRKVDANSGTMLELSVNGVNMDLQYCPAARVVERWNDMPSLHHSDPIFNLPVLSLRKLKPYRDIAYIQRTLPSITVFRTAYRCIKLWAVQRGIYSSKFGFLGGVHIALMLSWVCKRLALDVGSVSAAEVTAAFFHHYARFDWSSDMVFDALFHKKTPRYQRSAREPMVVLGFHTPNANVAYTSTNPGLRTLVKEFKKADERLSEDGMTWERFFGQEYPSSGQSELVGLTHEFLTAYDSYVQINIQYWGRSLSKGKGLVGWVESRSLLLVVDIDKALPGLDIRIWPSRFTSNDTADSDVEYQGCYLIGLAKDVHGGHDMATHDRNAARSALQKTMDRFLDRLHADEKQFDAKVSWIDVALVKQKDVRNMRLDEREWGDYLPEDDADSDSDDEEDFSESDQPAQLNPSHRKLPHRSSSTTASPLSSAKLRPASDVLNRLRWDPNFDPADYIIGYEDRFLGAKEVSLERWKTEQTDEEFIPQHRILYFKKRADGTVIWERATRVDALFGSGIGAGEV